MRCALVMRTCVFMQTRTWSLDDSSRQLPLGLELIEGRLCSPGILAYTTFFTLVPSPLSRLCGLLIILQGPGTSAVGDPTQVMSLPQACLPAFQLTPTSFP